MIMADGRPGSEANAGEGHPVPSQETPPSRLAIGAKMLRSEFRIGARVIFAQLRAKKKVRIRIVPNAEI